ncbi:MAG: RNA polymerase sigma factor [Acidimicrobiia bacterium]|nr:RNA polymerase sigma factor [Acidimicrobiia bacterium]
MGQNEETDNVVSGVVAERSGLVTGSTSFEEFYRRNHDRIWRALAVTLRNTHLASEAIDEAMTRAFERWDTVADYANPAGWCYRVGLNWATSRLRKATRETMGENVDRVYVDDEVADPTVTAALHQLSVNHREVIVMRYLLDWSINDIAGALEVPAGTVKSRLHRAVDHLNELLDRETTP